MSEEYVRHRLTTAQRPEIEMAAILQHDLNMYLDGLEQGSTPEDMDIHMGLLSPAQLKAVLDRLETLPYRNLERSIQPVEQALEQAEKLGIEELVMRARLVHADVLGRQGLTAESGSIVHEIHAWALEHQHKLILARSHRLLAAFFRRLGDNASALEHAVRALDHLPADVRAQTRMDHLMILALTLDETGAHEDSDRRFQEILDLADMHQDVQFALFALNNMAHTSYELGQAEAASELMARLRRLAEEHDVPLVALQLDTIARIEILLERPEEAERTLEPVILAAADLRMGDLVALPECLLTVAQAQCLQGKLDESQTSITEAARMIELQGLNGLKAQLYLQQSELYAAQGRYKEAYEEHRRFHQEAELMRSKEREARARILQYVFDAEEARRDSEHFREMALRDPLTGLYNRRFMDAHLDELIEHSVQTGTPLTIALIDLDFFKRINDTLSHEVGDAVLMHVAQIMTEHAVSTASVARLGGEEFVLVYPGMDLEEGRSNAEQLRYAIRTTDWRPITGSLQVTASIGLCTAAHRKVNRMTLLSQADHNLYVAKRSGKDRVVATEYQI
ncbi:diguanylate cyclase [Paenibacillus sp. JX-17]|uniref:Diguanylate cyclase n=1 Tax=Paenibacillus lacisoli TaxID=3064525 RepID=A0ABT9CFJ0_9BACL|nr:diguanylate cyclase [Paenibacillus sp. JX-17]MDO7907645.1 diguanylate cyclase [Paenibacillus sp. JX-17]